MRRSTRSQPKWGNENLLVYSPSAENISVALRALEGQASDTGERLVSIGRGEFTPPCGWQRIDVDRAEARIESAGLPSAGVLAELIYLVCRRQDPDRFIIYEFEESAMQAILCCVMLGTGVAVGIIAATQAEARQQCVDALERVSGYSPGLAQITIDRHFRSVAAETFVLPSA